MKRILVALDESDRAPHVLQAAVELARSVAGKLILLRVGADPTCSYSQNVYGPSPDLPHHTLEERIHRSLAAMAESLPPGLRGGGYVRLGVAWQQICSAATELDVDLIVMGAHGYRLLDRVVGTTAAQVVNHADCPVLVVRPPGARDAGARVSQP
jgi:nucleotide-binding universal stress UspA family protein